jgi:hypothetical protein
VSGLLDRIKGGRTDLVFDYVSAGNPPTPRTRTGRAGSVVRLLRRRERPSVPARPRGIASPSRRRSRAQRRGVPRPLAAVRVSRRKGRRRERGVRGHGRDAAPFRPLHGRSLGPRPGAPCSPRPRRGPQSRDQTVRRDGLLHAGLPNEGGDTPPSCGPPSVRRRRSCSCWVREPCVRPKT